MIRPIQWRQGVLHLLDQRHLPAQEIYLQCHTAAETAAAIKDMVVRGAPAIGVAAAFGMALGAARGEANAAEVLLQSRPTAVNLRWAVEKLVGLHALAAEAAAVQMLQDDIAANRAIGAHGASLLPQNCTLGTHCNTGSLATAGYGTALGVVRAALEQGKLAHLYVDETRPWLQGARLTMWECRHDGIPATLVADGAAAWLMKQRRVDAVVVGADRIARNGDTANKIGTYGLALAARAHGVPFYVAAPTSTVDQQLADGSGIPIEERNAEEVTCFRGEPVAPDGSAAWNPVFDVTPHELIAGIITEQGVWRVA